MEPEIEREADSDGGIHQAEGNMVIRLILSDSVMDLVASGELQHYTVFL